MSAQSETQPPRRACTDVGWQDPTHATRQRGHDCNLDRASAHAELLQRWQPEWSSSVRAVVRGSACNPDEAH